MSFLHLTSLLILATLSLTQLKAASNKPADATEVCQSTHDHNHEAADKDEHNDAAADKNDHNPPAADKDAHNHAAADKDERNDAAADKDEHNHAAADKDEHNDAAADKDEHNHAAAESEETLFLSLAQQREAGLQTGVAETGALPETFELLGTVVANPACLAVVVPPLPGFIRSLSVQAGATVLQGETLLTLFSPDLAEWKNNYLEKLRNTTLAEKTFARKEILRQKNIGTEADWQEAKFALDQARADGLFTARRLRAIGLSQNSLDQLEQQDPSEFGQFTVTAPRAGVILAHNATLGAHVESESLMQIADLSTVRADFQLNPKHLNHIQVGQAVAVTTLDGPAADGIVTLISPVINAANQTVTVSVTIANPNGDWRPGLFVRGQIARPGNRTAVLVPAEAVRDLDGRHVVFVPGNGEAFTIREVRRGQQRGGLIEILDGLNHGEQIVTIGAFTLKAVKATSGLDSHAGHGH